MKPVSTESRLNKTHETALIPARINPFSRILRFFAFFCIFTVVSNPEMWLIDFSTPAGPLSQDMLSLGGFFIFRGAV
jgi:hypothetical protein